MVAQVAKDGLQIAGNVVEDTDVFYAVVKGIVFPILDTISALYDDVVDPGLSAFYGALNGGLGFIGSVRVISDLNKWVNKSRSEWKETAQLVCNTAGKLISTFKYLEKVELISLGEVSKVAFANIPILTLASNILRLGSDSLAIWIAGRDIKKLRGDRAPLIASLEGWESIKGYLNSEGQENMNDQALNILRDQERTLGMEEGAPVTVDAVRGLCSNILQKECEEQNTGGQLPQFEDGDVNRFVNLRVEKYSVASANNAIDQKMKWVGIAFAISRIALTILLTVASALMIISLPAVVALTVSFGLTTGTIGLSSIIMSKMKGFSPQLLPPEMEIGGVKIH